MLTICNLLIRIKTASKIQKKFIYFSKDGFSINLLEALYREGLISGFKIIPTKNLLKIKLKYLSSGSSSIGNIKFTSTPGNLVFLPYSSLCKLYLETGIFLISTKEGVLTNQECIRKKLGGTAICHII